jgi:hypothetical protein
MKSLILIILIAVASCGIEENKATLIIEKAKQTEKKYLLDCEICVLEDSIQIISNQILNLKIQEKDFSKATTLQSRIKKELDELYSKHKKINEYPDYTYFEPIDFARKKCQEYFPFDYVKDSVKRDQLFNKYSNYDSYHRFGKLITNEPDINEYKKNKNGDYIIMKKGKPIYVSPEEYPKWWENVLDKYYKVDDYLEKKKREIIIEISGKNFDEFNSYEKSMFNQILKKKSFTNYDDSIIENDKKYQKLLNDFEIANQN